MKQYQTNVKNFVLLMKRFGEFYKILFSKKQLDVEPKLDFSYNNSFYGKLNLRAYFRDFSP